MGLGLILGLIALPAIALGATGQLVTITGGHNASVSPAGQLRMVEMDPTNYAQMAGSAGEGECTDLGAISPTRAYIIKSVNFNLTTAPIAGEVVGSALFVGPDCAAAQIARVYANPTEGRDIALGDGVGIRAGTHISLVGDGGPATVDVYGYTATASAVTHNPTVKSAGTPAGPR
jgi:hypothetical protein